MARSFRGFCQLIRGGGCRRRSVLVSRSRIALARVRDDGNGGVEGVRFWCRGPGSRLRVQDDGIGGVEGVRFWCRGPGSRLRVQDDGIGGVEGVRDDGEGPSQTNTRSDMPKATTPPIISESPATFHVIPESPEAISGISR